MVARWSRAAERAGCGTSACWWPRPQTIPQFQTWVGALLQGLAQLGWIDGRNVRIDIRWATANADDLRRHAAESAVLATDVLVAATGTATAAPLLQATRTGPIVFVQVIDPVGAGFVASLAQPGGNATGFTSFEYGLSGKWLELLKQITPSMTRAAVLRDPAVASGIGQFAAIQAVAPSLGVELRRLMRAMPPKSSAPSRHSRFPAMVA